MKDLRADVGGLLRGLSQAPAENGRIVLLISPHDGAGVTSVCASLALKAAETARKPVWHLDLDLHSNAAFQSFAVGPFADRFGGVGPPYSAALRTEPFFQIQPQETDAPQAGAGIFTAHRVGDTRMMVTQFDAARLKPGQTLKIRTQPDYWKAVRESTDWAFIDAPSFERSTAALAIASQADACLIAVRADRTTALEVAALRKALTEHGGRIAGLVLNRQKSDARFFERLAG